MTRRCAFDPDCRSLPIPTTPAGTVFANCFRHHAILAPAWHDTVRAYQLRPSIVGGIPIDQDPVLGDEDTGAVPFAS